MEKGHSNEVENSIPTYASNVSQSRVDMICINNEIFNNNRMMMSRIPSNNKYTWI